MKIGFDAKRAFSNNTGLGNYSRDTIRLLSENYPDKLFFLFTPKEKKNNRISSITKKKNTVVHTPISLLDKLLPLYWRSRSIIKELSNNKIEIYHGLSNEIPLGIEKTSIKTVVTIHDLIFIRYPHFFTNIDKKIYYTKFKSSCKRADKIIAISQQTKKDIINFFNIPAEKIEVVYQGCNEIFKKEASENQKKNSIKKYNLPENFLLYVGTIEERKNLLTLLETIKELPNEKLVIIGDGRSYKKKCLNYISENHLSERVWFLNKISLEEMANIYQLAQIMIYPSIFEGFGIPIIEALFSKLPVITSKGGCFIEAGGPDSRYINPSSITEIKEAIIEIKKSPQLRKKMAQNGLKYAKKFADDRIASNLMLVYRNL